MSIPANFENKLNPEQLRAVECLNGPLLILAGAGSGKTRVLTYRIVNLIIQGAARTDEILAVTFTNKAARGMLERTMNLLYEMQIPVTVKPWISTFHSSCARILRDHITLLGYEPQFVIYDDSEQLAVIKKVCESLELNDKIYPPKSFQARINEAKTQALTPEEMSKKSLNFFDEKNLKVYELYERTMKKANALDFGDLLLKTVELFRQHPKVLEAYRERFKYILVDEYQDTNHIQYLLLNILAKGHQNLCVVGDEDQSIYSWRGADITNILNFEADYPNAQVVKLEQNYRSTQTIVNAASHLIRNNTQRKDKTLFSENTVGDLIRLREEFNEHKEAQFVCREIQSLVQDGDAQHSDVAVFYRTNAQSRVLEDQMRMFQIPYKLVGATQFYDRMEVKDLISYLKLILNPKDDLAAKRIINKPTRRIGKTTTERLEQISMVKHITMLEAVKWATENKEFNNNATKAILAFSKIIEDVQVEIPGKTLIEIYDLVAEKSGYLEALQAEDTVESQVRLENLGELRSAIIQFEKERGTEATLQNFLEELALVTDRGEVAENVPTVTMMTLHLSKGLEYPYVFMVGLEEGLLPSRQSFDSLDPTAAEEERRLCYVGMTRAEKRLYLLHARQRFLRGVEEHFPPSRFIAEIPTEFIQKSSAISTPKIFQKMTSFSRIESDSYSTHYSEEESQVHQDEMSDGYERGMRVRHPIFGVGVIHSTEGNGTEQRVTVLFNNSTLKKFAVKFARLDRV
ncbi:MAG: ATP-dependent helicase [Bdellovibrionales bacterium]